MDHKVASCKPNKPMNCTSFAYLGVLFLEIVGVEVEIGQGGREARNPLHFCDNVMKETEWRFLQQRLRELRLQGTGVYACFELSIMTHFATHWQKIEFFSTRKNLHAPTIQIPSYSAKYGNVLPQTRSVDEQKCCWKASKK